MIDTHCHLTYEGLVERVEQVVADAASVGVDRMICVGTSPHDAQRALALADRFPGVYAAVGLHPHHAHEWPDREVLLEALRQAATHPKVLALGEMGMDRHYPDPPLDLQRRSLEWQLALAADLPAMPIIIHNRQATDDVLPVIRAAGLPGQRFVFHCFTGSDQELDDILALGAMVSFTGIVTFKSAAALAQSARRVPLERLMVETDSPYLTPEPYRKVRPNEPRYVADTMRFLARLRDMEDAAFAAQMDANARRFFRLP